MIKNFVGLSNNNDVGKFCEEVKNGSTKSMNKKKETRKILS